MVLISVKKTVILAVYFSFFWIVLPGSLLFLSYRLDKSLFNAAYLSDSFVIPGIVIFLTGIALFFTSVFQFKKFSGQWPVSAMPPDKIIEKGLFSVIRHPVYVFALIALIGAAFILRSKGLVFVVLPGFIILLSVYILFEEKMLLKRHGKNYLLYRKRVPLVLPRFYYWLWMIAWPLFSLVFHLKTINRANVPGNCPFFVVSSHRNYLDPFFISVALPFQVKHVCTFEMFRKPLTAIFFKWLGAIPKKRYKKDVDSVRQIIKAINKGYCVGIFPEGGRSWTGEMRTLKNESLKLFRRFHSVPILPVRVEGNYHAWPRWSNKVLKADVSVIFEKPIYLEGNESLEVINDLLVERIPPGPDNEAHLSCRNDFLHSKLSIVVYRCPACMSHSTLDHSIPDRLVCRECNTQFKISKHFDFFYDEIRKETIQQVYSKIKIKEDDLSSNLSHNRNETKEQVLYKSAGILYVEKNLRFQKVLTGYIILSNNCIIVGNGRQTLKIELAKVGAVTIESNYKLQLYLNSEDLLYQMVFPGDSVLKWQDYIELILVKKYNKQLITR